MMFVFHWSKAQIQASKSWACHWDVMVTSDVTSKMDRPPVESDVTILGVDLKITRTHRHTDTQTHTHTHTHIHTDTHTYTHTHAHTQSFTAMTACFLCHSV